jgi:lipid-A-disaccharide synthase
VFGTAVSLAKEQIGTMDLVLPTVAHLADHIRGETEGWSIAPRIVVEPQQKWAEFRRARAALAASGTVTLELALAGVPTVLAYRVALIEELIVRATIQVSMVGLANLILGDKAMPELLQRQATPENLAGALAAIIGDTPARQRQIAAFQRLDSVMEVGGGAPSARAAAIVIDVARQAHAAPHVEI